MKKIADWLYWTGNRYFIIANFIMGIITLVSFGINDESIVGTITAIIWIVSIIAFLFFDFWYEKHLTNK